MPVTEAIQDIYDIELKFDVDCSLYIDDIQICYRSSNIRCDDFRSSKTNTVCIHICQKRGSHLDPQLLLDTSTIAVVEKTKFMEVIFDWRLSFVLYLKYVKKKGLKAIIYIYITYSQY